MSYTLRIDKTVSGEAYDIIINDSFEGLKGTIRSLSFRPYKLCVVTDTTVGPRYAFEIENILSAMGFDVSVFTFPAGEEFKNLDTVSDLYRFLIGKKFDRKSALVALGGGVVGDLTGFAAATYLRGIPFIQIPTTLLADTDSSIGGKTGVDLDEYKNMVGAFYMPSLVFINVSVLDTLTERDYHSGMAESVKHAFIRDGGLITLLNEKKDELGSRDRAVLMELVYKSLLIKAAVVSEDPNEKGVRAILNFGHTLGHAIEKHMDFKLTHGECVSLGSVCALYISYLRGNISPEEFKASEELLKEYSLPVRLRDNFDMDEVIRITYSDKKNAAGALKFILLKSMGEALAVTDVTEDEMRKGLEYIRDHE